MSPPYDRYDRGSSRSRRGLGTWAPLAITLTVATVGVAAWLWSQRKDGKEEEEESDQAAGLDYDNADYGENPPYGASSRSLKDAEQSRRSDEQSRGVATAAAETDANEAGWGARMSGALRRTPSPQHLFDSTGKNIAAGMAAAGAVMGKALASIREEDGNNNPWSEEADAKKEWAPSPVKTGNRRKAVAIVVSADTQLSTGGSDDGYLELASILSHIPRHNNFSQIKLFVLIYAPHLTAAAMDTATSNLPPPSLSSSFSNIGHDQAQTPGDEPRSPVTSAPVNPAYDDIYAQARELAEKESMILPFTTPNGYAHMLHHLLPEVLYLQESLAGNNGSVITSLQNWFRHDVVLVVGADNGSGGLADSESEAEKSSPEQQWWQRPERVGRGRGIVVVDGMRVNDDWARRVQGRE